MPHAGCVAENVRGETMTITFDHPGGPGVVFVLALAYRWLCGYTMKDGELQPDYCQSAFVSITETAETTLVIDFYTHNDAAALIQVCARSAEGRLDEECPL